MGLVALAPARAGHAQHAQHAETSPVVAKVGAVTITAADLERRLAAVPGFQLRTFGATPAEIKRVFLEHVMVRDALLAQAAEDRGLEHRTDVRERIHTVLRGAMLGRLRADTAPVDEDEVKAYYEKNAAKFHTPERYALWLIATRKREEAAALLTELHKDPSPKRWQELARAQSIDGPTAMRGGNLGFVNADGTTPEPGLKVSRAVIDAVEKLHDAEMSPDPVKDGERWVIVWRRQTMKSVERPVETETGSIKQMILYMRTQAKVKETLAALRKEHLGEHNPDLLDLFDVTPQGELTQVRRPGALPTGRHAPANPVPAPGSLR